jgi:hypothetical protein
MHCDRLGPNNRNTCAEQRERTSFLRSLLFLDAGMYLYPNLTLRVLNWAEPDLAELMANEYGYAGTPPR